MNNEPRKDSGIKEVVQGREYMVGDESVNDAQRVGDRVAPELFWSTTGEAYVEGCCEIHVHFRASTVEGRILGDWCAAIKKAEKNLNVVSADVVGNKERESGEIVEGSGMWQAMLFLNRKLVKLPKRVAAEPVLSRVRLHPLQLCLSEWVDSMRVFMEPSTPFRFKALQMVERSLEPPFVVEGHGSKK
jgi:hypothetical protein